MAQISPGNQDATPKNEPSGSETCIESLWCDHTFMEDSQLRSMVEEQAFQVLAQRYFVKTQNYAFHISERDEDNDFLSLNFPSKLWKLVESEKFKSIWWDEAGTAIVINEECFKKEVLERETPCRIFETNKMKSIIRQLNLYGFRRMKESFQRSASLADFLAEENGASVLNKLQFFQNSNFKRGCPQLLPRIKRRFRTRNRLPVSPVLVPHFDEKNPTTKDNMDIFNSSLDSEIGGENVSNPPNLNMHARTNYNMHSLNSSLVSEIGGENVSNSPNIKVHARTNYNMHSLNSSLVSEIGGENVSNSPNIKVHARTNYNMHSLNSSLVSEIGEENVSNPPNLNVHARTNYNMHSLNSSLVSEIGEENVSNPPNLNVHARTNYNMHSLNSSLVSEIGEENVSKPPNLNVHARTNYNMHSLNSSLVSEIGEENVSNPPNLNVHARTNYNMHSLNSSLVSEIGEENVSNPPNLNVHARTNYNMHSLNSSLVSEIGEETVSNPPNLNVHPRTKENMHSLNSSLVSEIGGENLSNPPNINVPLLKKPSTSNRIANATDLLRSDSISLSLASIRPPEQTVTHQHTILHQYMLSNNSHTSASRPSVSFIATPTCPYHNVSLVQESYAQVMTQPFRCLYSFPDFISNESTVYGPSPMNNPWFSLPMNTDASATLPERPGHQHSSVYHHHFNY
ncbi:uncharacterized protein LOC134474712 [Cavia porcellus]|uniref:uncharacterized protein LOC134474712 n=1 Tax=Cavia porcellus TaxID=10141 RepID=UPI002FE14B6E